MGAMFAGREKTMGSGGTAGHSPLARHSGLGAPRFDRSLVRGSSMPAQATREGRPGDRWEREADRYAERATGVVAGRRFPGAYTFEGEIHLPAGVDLASPEGRRLAAHEEAHAIQQSGGDPALDLSSTGGAMLQGDFLETFAQLVVPGAAPLVPVFEEHFGFKQLMDDIQSSIVGCLNLDEEAKKQLGEGIVEHWDLIVLMSIGVLAAEGMVVVLAAIPHPAAKIAALVLQAALLAFAIWGAVQATTEVIHCAQRWWSLVRSADGNSEVIRESSLEFARLLIAITLLILAALDVRAAFRATAKAELGGQGGARKAGPKEEPKKAPKEDTAPSNRPLAKTPKQARLAEFFRRLKELPAARTTDEALEQIRKTMDEVEDELSGIPRKDPPPPPSMDDGRMYPPLDDRIVRQPDGGLKVDTRGQWIEIGPDGSIKVTNRKTGQVEFSKPGGA